MTHMLKYRKILKALVYIFMESVKVSHQVIT